MTLKTLHLKPVIFLFLSGISYWSCSEDSSVHPDAGVILQSDGSNETDGGKDPTASVFLPDHLLKVEIVLAKEDWEKLRYDGRNFNEVTKCVTGPRLFDYKHFSAEVTIDGTKLSQVDIRKKGFYGSLSLIRPSLKLHFDTYIPGRRYMGMERMTLNNNRQDPSLVRQCLTYQLFTAAGLPAPRCNLAHVTVNGKDLGIYTHVESIKKAFLKRHFTSAEGNLYEGQVADFIPGLVDVFETKTNPTTNDRSDLAKVVSALEKKDTEVVSSLESIVDLDKYIDFWVMESMTAHWDGYNGGANNFYLYHDPLQDRFFFIPWGTDGSFDPRGGLLPPDRPQSVLARGFIAHRLYAIDLMKKRYIERMRQLLDQVWQEQKLLATIDAFESLVGKYARKDHLDHIRQIVRERRKEITSELDAGGAEWTIPPRSAACDTSKQEQLSGTFDTTWDTINDLVPTSQSSATFSGTYDGAPVSLSEIFATAGNPVDQGVTDPNPSIRLIGKVDGDYYILQISVEPELFTSNSKIPFHGFSNVGYLVTLPRNILGIVSEGSVTLDQASMSPGGRVKGSFKGILFH